VPDERKNRLMNETAQMFAVIPAFEPGEELLSVVSALGTLRPELNIIVVNDGSRTDGAKDVFRRLRDFHNCHLLEHRENRGKGAALKSGFKEITGRDLTNGLVVTADADGQHLAGDIIKVLDEGIRTSGAVIGVRHFSTSVPMRSFVGNNITKRALRLVMGVNVADTQSGLRAFPLTMLAALIETPGEGYEYEMSQFAGVLSNAPFREIPIETVYEPGNPSSHFHPVIDSMKIYWVLFRHSLVSLCIGALDFIILFSLVSFGLNVTLSVLISRAISGIFYFTAMRRGVFRCSPITLVMVLKFGLNIAINLMLFEILFNSVQGHAPNTAFALIVTYLIFYTFNFLFQKYVVFVPQGPR
jgi:glycosyltransferase involved in cell wall biosynthesis